MIDGFSGSGWVTLAKKDFAQVNCDPNTFQFGEEPGTLHCTGNPFGGLRSVKIYKNFEMVLEWRHNKHSGNAGIFIWCPRKVLDTLPGDDYLRELKSKFWILDMRKIF